MTEDIKPNTVLWHYQRLKHDIKVMAIKESIERAKRNKREPNYYLNRPVESVRSAVNHGIDWPLAEDSDLWLSIYNDPKNYTEDGKP